MSGLGCRAIWRLRPPDRLLGLLAGGCGGPGDGPDEAERFAGDGGDRHLRQLVAFAGEMAIAPAEAVARLVGDRRQLRWRFFALAAVAAGVAPAGLDQGLARPAVAGLGQAAAAPALAGGIL